jgi:hypothetical protein
MEHDTREQVMSIIVDAGFERIAAMLKLDSSSPEYAFADAFRSRLQAEIPAEELSGGHLGIETRLEEAIVWRVLCSRVIAQLGSGSLFELRDKGAASGTSTVHPAPEALAKHYERLKRCVDELTQATVETADTRPKGLPDLMKPILEETEVVFDELLGPGGFPGRASTNGSHQGHDRRE